MPEKGIRNNEKEEEEEEEFGSENLEAAAYILVGS
jgi:hypothetical protein